MTVLVDFQIRKYCQEQSMIVPFDESLLNPASLDVRIGTTMQREASDGGMVAVDLAAFSKEFPLMIQPKEFILVGTQEVFNIPPTVAGKFYLKSSRAREGWEHLLAGWCDPGWHGSVLTLELVNVRRFKCLPIYPGLKIGQIVFEEVTEPERCYKQTGRYNNDLCVMGSKG